ncbi:flagellar M-ring protein FliF [Kiloniella litopenaei]|uniref:Flagellar M-ring protein n=1 Tax=Kiloniella litopenaei TaxID=1549748 RepID=A0A0M2R9T7_9PROT|nr:flagellar basal-body MS-ring/collar protein FliF [Kiloniella litopenaei]KKJ76368.1 flagellar M-ring protein FliF [Kiloniella litopenaei]
MNTFVDTLKNLGPVRLGIMAGVAAAIIAFFIYLTGRVATPEMALLYADLDTQDGGQIVSELEQLQVPYKLSPAGDAVYVPSNKVGAMRVAMAEKGLPSGGSIGYEIFDQSEALGTTSFVQNINHLRALEGELSRTVKSINRVKQARVHLVLPQRELFSRDKQSPSASVVVTTQGNNTLDRQQILSIQHLISAAVPGMKPLNVSIIDDKGNLLARGGEEGDLDQLTSTADERRVAYETRLMRTVEELLERYVGRGNAQVQISAEMDFDRVTENSETFDPDGQVVLSTQTVEESANEADNAGNEGITVGNNLPDANLGQLGGASGSQSNSSRLEETVNFENSKIIKTRIRETGAVRRLSVAVIINDITEVNEEGVRTFTSRSEEDLAQLGAIVRSAVGFDESRGDTVEVANFRFAELDPLLLPEEGVLGMDKEDMMRFAELFILGVVAILILLLVVRPLVTRVIDGDFAPVGDGDGGGTITVPGPDGRPMVMAVPAGGAGAPGATMIPGMPAQIGADGTPLLTSTAGGTDEAGLPTEAGGVNNEIEQMIDMNKVEGRVRASSLNKIGEIVEKHPEEAVQILRGWLYQEGK